MNALPKVGRFLYALPLAVFGLFHFLNGSAMAGMVPIPGGIFWVYLTGIALFAAVAAIITGKQAVLATQLLALMLLIFAFSIHLVAVIGGDQASMPNFLKDVALAGGALVLSGVLAAEQGGSEGA